MSIVLSISCITYNHAPYIRECLDSFLMQKTTFPIEVVIHDDCSTDGTKEIIEEYATKYPDIIFPMFQTENQYSKGVRGMMARFNFPRCRGKYIALCEGDDYWTDPFKLQKQVNFLEANPDYVGCFHKIKVLLEANLFDDEVIEQRFEKVENKNKVTRLDLFEQGNFIHTCSFLFRNKPIVLSNEMVMSPVGDIMLFLEIAKTGFFKRIDEYMAVYRRGTGTYSSLSNIEMYKKKLQYHMCILSSLTDEVERKLFLKICIDLIGHFEKTIKFERKSFVMKKIASIKILIYKIMGVIKKK